MGDVRLLYARIRPVSSTFPTFSPPPLSPLSLSLFLSFSLSLSHYPYSPHLLSPLVVSRSYGHTLANFDPNVDPTYKTGVLATGSVFIGLFILYGAALAVDYRDA